MYLIFVYYEVLFLVSSDWWHSGLTGVLIFLFYRGEETQLVRTGAPSLLMNTPMVSAGTSPDEDLRVCVCVEGGGAQGWTEVEVNCTGPSF